MYCVVKTPHRPICLVHCSFASAGKEGRKKGKEEGVTILLEIGPPNRWQICTLTLAVHIKAKLLSYEDADAQIRALCSPHSQSEL